MLTLLVAALLSQTPITPLTPEEKYKRRVTPVVEVAEAAAPAVVYIQTEQFKNVQDWMGRVLSMKTGAGAGSGVVIMKEGFIITNYHVVEGATNITVSFDKRYDESDYKAEVISAVKQEDLALLRIRGEREFPTIPMGTSSDLMIGETVVAIGNPYGQTLTVSQGIISGLHRNVNIPNNGLHFDDLIQTDASINFGNSGGPLLNINGDLIGINSAMNAQAQNIGFALPVDRVKAVLEEELMPTWLGFDVEVGDHLKVQNVIAGGPAAQAGIQEGDCIVSLNNRPVVKQEDYRLARVGLANMQEVDVEVERDGKTRSIRLRVWDRPNGILFERLGMKGEKVGLGNRTYVRVTEVQPGGPADKLGMKIGDVIDAVHPNVSIADRERSLMVGSPEQLAWLVSELPAKSEIFVDLYRDLDGNRHFSQDELHRGLLTLR
ncbi:MAG: trypsin-like peptidase domain-containing protein [Planctomycetes bacterium]|nr:trypsin-like peptidase domain-containing protein [Planctomycetota bacterium]